MAPWPASPTASTASAVRWSRRRAGSGGASRVASLVSLVAREPVDRGHRDVQPGGPVAGLVEDLVDRLVGLERAQQQRLPSWVRAPRPGVAGQEGLAVAVCPLGGA